MSRSLRAKLWQGLGLAAGNACALMLVLSLMFPPCVRSHGSASPIASARLRGRVLGTGALLEAAHPRVVVWHARDGQPVGDPIAAIELLPPTDPGPGECSFDLKVARWRRVPRPGGLREPVAQGWPGGDYVVAVAGARQIEGGSVVLRMPARESGEMPYWDAETTKHAWRVAEPR